MIRTRIFIALLILCLPLGALAAVSVQEAEQAFRQGQYPAALDKVNTFLATNAKDAQGRFLKGLILTELNHYADAIKIFSGLTEDYPELPEPYNNLAVLYAAQGQYDQAKQSLEMAIRTHPSYATAHENLGDIYAKMASQSYDKALQLDRSNTSAQTKLSLIKDLFNPTPHATESAAKATIKTAAKETKAAKTAQAQEAMPAKQAQTPVVVAEAAKPTVATDTPTATKIEDAAKQPAKADTPAASSTVRYDTTDKMLHAWAKAWSDRDVAAYLSFYGPNFKTPKGKDRAAWDAERKERLERAKSIKVEVGSVNVRIKGKTAKLKFKQHYASNLLRSDSKKTMLLERVDGGWRIVEER